MDDMIGAMLDIDDGVQEIIDWIANNGGYVENALYVTADHDHYLTLLENFPETLAMKTLRRSVTFGVLAALVETDRDLILRVPLACTTRETTTVSKL
jgi:alkaline phosphatase